MSDLERILKLASHGTDKAQGQAPAERELKDVPVVAEDDLDDSQSRQLEAWCKKWSKYKGMNGDPLPMGWVLSIVDTGVTTDGIENGEADKAIEVVYPGKGAEMKSDMNKGDAQAYNVDWGDFEIQKHLPITNAMKDEFIAIMGNDDEETMHEVYDVVKSACMESTNEAVGEFAEPIYDLIDMHFEGDCQPVFDDLVRFLSGDQIKEFVDDFRRHHELPMGDEETEESVEPTEPSTEEGNEFSGALAKAKKDGKKEFEVDGKKYKVEESEAEAEETEELEEVAVAEDDKEELEESPTMDTTQLITLLKNAGLSEEKIKTKLDEWANTPAGAAEEEATSHGEPYENFAQSVNLSLKRYLDAEDMKVGLKEHKVEDIKEAYKKSKEK